MLCRWIKQLPELQSCDSSTRRVGNPGRKAVLYESGIEAELHDWVLKQRENAFTVSYTEIQSKVKSMIPVEESFKASQGWLYGFLKRWNLSYRSPTSQVAACHFTDKNKTQKNLKLQQFHKHLTDLYRNNAIGNVYNVDQTPVWWNAMCEKQKTIDSTGKRKILARVSNGNPREKVSVILACSQTGEKLPPAIIVKSNSTRLKRARIKLVDGVMIFQNPKTSMANSDIMERWIRTMMPTVTEGKKNVLILDSFRGHLTDGIGVACTETNTLRAVIPGGLTSHIQPLDLTVNRSFKSHLRKLYHVNSQKVSVKDRLATLARAVRIAWNRTKPKAIRNGFKVMMRELRSHQL